MEKFLGILFAGGKGTRLGLITDYISKAFVPIYDRPVFMYPLKQLQDSEYINEIIILTRPENNNKLSKLEYGTIIQDDEKVKDMFSGLKFIKEKINTDKNFVLMPCDNISEIDIDKVIEIFNSSKNNVDITFNLKRIDNSNKLKEMGVYDFDDKSVIYKPGKLPSNYGVITPYIVKNEFNFEYNKEHNIINDAIHSFNEYNSYWFDVGDRNSVIKAANFIRGIKSNV